MTQLLKFVPIKVNEEYIQAEIYADSNNPIAIVKIKTLAPSLQRKLLRGETVQGTLKEN